MKPQIFLKSIILTLVITLLSSSVIYAGSITSPGGTPSPTSYTLGDIFKKITTNVSATLGNHSLTPTTTPQSTYDSLTSIYNAIPTFYAGDFLASSTYFGVTGSIGVRAGNTTVVTSATSSNTLILTPPVGYYDGTVTVSTSTTYFDSTNIKNGITVFGITGTFGSGGGGTPTILNKTLVRTGQTLCYNAAGAIIACAGTGQDGELLRGVARSYTDNGNGTISDNATGLMWQKCTVGLSDNNCSTGSATTIDFATATSTCAGLSLGGFSNWRVPNIRELMSIVDFSVAAPTINGTYFPNTPSNWFRTSTTYIFGRPSSFEISFEEGIISWRNFTGLNSVRCVRTDPSPPSPPTTQLGQTGQAACFDYDSGKEISCVGTKEDAETLDGAARSYTDNGNSTITDNTTGLMWQKCPGGYVGAFCEDFDNSYSYPFWINAPAKCASATTGGHNDWRMPNIIELLSLTDSIQYEGEPDTKYFPNTHNKDFMSNTSYPLSLNRYLTLSIGFNDTSSKSSGQDLRCVRN